MFLMPVTKVELCWEVPSETHINGMFLLVVSLVLVGLFLRPLGYHGIAALIPECYVKYCWLDPICPDKSNTTLSLKGSNSSEFVNVTYRRHIIAPAVDCLDTIYSAQPDATRRTGLPRVTRRIPSSHTFLDMWLGSLHLMISHSLPHI
jgi:hypothetical protein